MSRVHDLHVWATGTSEVALTAHLVMPGGHPDDPFFEAVTHLLRERFRIGHVTLQVVREPFMTLCEDVPSAGQAVPRRADRAQGPCADPDHGGHAAAAPR